MIDSVTGSKKIIILAVLVVILLLISYFLFGKRRVEAPQEPPALITPEIVEKYYTVPPGNFLSVPEETIKNYYTIRETP
jgi:hypothetical protein